LLVAWHTCYLEPSESVPIGAWVVCLYLLYASCAALLTTGIGGCKLYEQRYAQLVQVLRQLMTVLKVH
jgi:hypothetical protein